MVVKKRIPTSLKVDPELWEEVKIMAIRTKKNITEYFEDALREKLVKDYEIVSVERKMKEQERLHKEQVNRQYQMIVGGGGGQDPVTEQKQESQLQGQELKPPDIFNKDTITPLVGDQFELKLWIPSLRFPTDKDKIIQHIKSLNTHEVSNPLYFVEKIPDRIYNDVYQLEEEIKKACNSDKDLIESAEQSGIDEGMIVGCRIIVDEDKNKFLNLQQNG